MSHDTLYYDGRCPLCSTEMKKLQLYAQDTLQLVDIHSLSDEADLPDKKILLSELHLKQADGKFLRGLEANVAAWQHTRFGIFYSWLGWPMVSNVADWVYSRWAKVRYRRLYDEKGGDLGS